MLLPDGRVLVLSISLASRSDGTDGPGLAEIYDPASGTFAAAASTPHGARTATLLPDGRVFLTAPWEELPATNDQTGPFTIWSGIYDPATGLTQDGPAPPAGRQQPALLADGRILLVGGEVNRRPLDGPPDSAPWAELYEWR